MAAVYLHVITLLSYYRFGCDFWFLASGLLREGRWGGCEPWHPHWSELCSHTSWGDLFFHSAPCVPSGLECVSQIILAPILFYLFIFIEVKSIYDLWAINYLYHKVIQPYIHIYILFSLYSVWSLWFIQDIEYYHSVQFSSVAQSCPTLCDPLNRSTPGLPVHHQLLEFTQTRVHRVGDAIQPSHPLSSPSPTAPNPSQHQSLFQWVNSSHEVAKVLEFQL